MKRRVRLLLAAVALLAPALALLVSEVRGGRALERRIYDGWFTIRGELDAPPEVVIVAIDVESEQSLGRYPWSRVWHAKLLRNLHRAGARVVAFDATFADAFPADDSVFRAAIEETGIAVLGAKTQLLVRRHASGSGLEEPTAGLRGAPLGIVNVAKDAIDGVVREYPIAHEYPQGVVPQLGVSALLQYLAIDSLRTLPDGWQLGDRFIPRGPGGGMLIDYVGGTASVPTYSYADVVDDADTDIGEWDMDGFEDYLVDSLFHGRIVLVGSTVPEHQDLHTTPFRDADAGPGAEVMPGVEIHAHAVAALLQRRHIRPLSWPLQWAWTVVLALIVVGATVRLRGVRGAGFAVLVPVGALALAWYAFTQHGLWLWSVAPVLSAGLAYAGSAAVLFVAEEQEKARIRGMFQQYVAASVVDELIRRPELLALGGEERVATMLFSDVVSFSSVSERLTPTELVALLNEYLTVMTDIVVAHGGIIDKYQGDALMAEFGVPVPVADHALRACRAALDMRRELARLREQWASEGKPQLRARIGINTGICLVGNLGSNRIMDYTVMGDHVNLASRLEGTNKAYGTEILVSAFTWREVAHALIGREIDRVRVVGKEEAVAIHEVMATVEEGVDAATVALLAAFGAALELYRTRLFTAALDAFVQIAARHPEDGPTRVYIERCREYVAAPPPVEWDGVYRLVTK